MTGRRGAWLPSELGTEGIRNLLARGSKLMAAALLAVAIGSALSLWALLEWRGLQREISGLTADGWSMYVVEVQPGSANGIDASTCESLARNSRVARTIGLRARTLEHFSEIGVRSVPVVAVGSANGIGLRPPTLPGAIPVMVGADLESLLSGTRWLTAEDGTKYEITGRVPSDLNALDLSGSIVIVERLRWPTTPLKQCFAEAFPSASEDSGGLVGSSVGADTVDLLTRRTHATVGDHPYHRFLSRPGRRVYLFAGVVVGAVIGVVMRSRSSEIGTYRITGASSTQIVLLLGIETSIVLGIWLMSSFLGSWMIELVADVPALATWRSQVHAVAAAAFIAGPTALYYARKDVSMMLKDR